MTASPISPVSPMSPVATMSLVHPPQAPEAEPHVPEPHAAARLLERVHARLRQLPHPVRVATITLVGTVLVLAGIAMLVLPGPGLVVLFAGVAVLSTEFPWASRLLHKMKVLGTRAWDAFVRTRLGQAVRTRIDRLSAWRHRRRAGER